jgi:hypothetical protein
MDISFFLSGQGSIHHQKLSDKKPLLIIKKKLIDHNQLGHGHTGFLI